MADLYLPSPGLRDITERWREVAAPQAHHQRVLSVEVISGGGGGGLAQLQVRDAAGVWDDVGYAAGNESIPVNVVAGAAGGGTAQLAVRDATDAAWTNVGPSATRARVPVEVYTGSTAYDARSIRALTATDVVTAAQGAAGAAAWLTDPSDRAARLLGRVYGSQGAQLQQRAISNDLLVQVVHAAVEIDPRAIRTLTTSDQVSAALLAGTSYVGRVRQTDGTLDLTLLNAAPGSDTGQVAVPVRVISSLAGGGGGGIVQQGARDATAARWWTEPYGSQTQMLQQRATSFDLLVQLRHAAAEIDPRAIRTLTTTDQVTAFQGTAPWNVGGSTGAYLQQTATNFNLKVELWNAAAQAIGQKAMAASLPVVIASDQTAIPVSMAAASVLFRGSVATFRTPGRGGTVGQKILAIYNAVGSAVTVTVKRLWFDAYMTVVKAITVAPPLVKMWLFTAAPTNGTVLTKNKIGGTTTSNASVEARGDASADGTGSATTLTVTLPAGTFIRHAFAPRFITAAGYEMIDRELFEFDAGVVLAPGNGICVFLDYVLATQNPTTDMWTAGGEWEET